MSNSTGQANAEVSVYYPRWVEILICKLWFRPRMPVGKARRLGLIERLMGRRRIRVLTRPGFLFACDQTDWLQRNLLCNRIHEEEVTDRLATAFRSNDLSLIHI